ncbi:MAG: PUR family DNA/RNA-binding protein [Bacteroidetes bacterium]|nr:PUR family DNA/RNA-binding protein [Bacteroidota bacterium]
MADEREDVYSKVVRAGKRTYFFDVRSTRGNDLFLTITESKKRLHEDGGTSYEKHKIFLYKEDFEKFMDGLQHTLDELERIREHGAPHREERDPSAEGNDHPRTPESFGNVDFDDLGKP